MTGKLAAGRIHIISTCLARRGDDARINEYFGKTPDPRRRRTLEAGPRKRIERNEVELAGHVPHKGNQFAGMGIGINDSDAHARELVALVRDVPCKFNLIPFNPFPNSGFDRSPAPRIKRFAEILIDAGIVTTTRKTRGDDVDAACGQLAGQVTDKTRRTTRIIPVAGA